MTDNEVPKVRKQVQKKNTYLNTSNRLVGLVDGSTLFPGKSTTAYAKDMGLALERGYVTKQ